MEQLKIIENITLFRYHVSVIYVKDEYDKCD